MRYFSLFTGVGGFEIGIEKAYADLSAASRKEPRQPSRDGAGIDGEILPGQQPAHHRTEPAAGSPSDGCIGESPGDTERESVPGCVGFSEIDKHASAVLRYRFPDIKNYGDITKIRWDRVPDFDLLVGGSPCQDLSIAGKRAGLEGGRSGLFYEYVRALEEKKPEHFIWENVKGALSSNGGRDFGAVLSALAEAGYSLWWQVLNAKDFGVPQNRERVFVVGTRTGSPREVFFERGDVEEAAIDTLTPPGTSDAFRVYGTDGVSKTLAANGGGTGAKTGLIVSDPAIIDDYNHRIKTDDIVPAVRQTFGVHAPNNGAKVMTLSPDTRIRRLTPMECERLMSWPDSWTKTGDYGEGPKDIADTQRYKMCGNGVVSEVVAQVVAAHIF